MNRNLVLLGICLLAVSFVGEVFGQKKKPRIGIAGIQIENSVFVPNRQPLVGHPVRMPDYLSPDSAMGQAATWLWCLNAHSYVRYSLPRPLKRIDRNLPGFHFL